MGSILPERRNQIRHVRFSYWDGYQACDPHCLGKELSYAHLSGLQIRSALPDASVRRREMIAEGLVEPKVTEHWAVDEIVREMEGLKIGTVVGWTISGSGQDGG